MCWKAWDQSQGHRTISLLEKRGIERGSAQWFSLWGWERAISTDLFRVILGLFQKSKETLAKLLWDRMEWNRLFWEHKIPSWMELYRTETAIQVIQMNGVIICFFCVFIQTAELFFISIYPSIRESWKQTFSVKMGGGVTKWNMPWPFACSVGPFSVLLWCKLVIKC